jgi:hypothetical protein
MNLPHYLPGELARVGLAVTLAASVATLWGCGEEPNALAEAGPATVDPAEPKPDDLDMASHERLQGESSRVVDKQAFIDDTLSCSSLPDRTCPGVTLRMANRSLFIVNTGESVPLDPAPDVQEVFQSGNGMRAGIDLNSISCGYSGGRQVTFTEELKLRFNTETELIAQSNGTALVRPPSPITNISDKVTFSVFACPDSRIEVIAAGFEPTVVQARGRFISGTKGKPDAQLFVDGTAQFSILCESTLNLDNVVIERDRPRDLLSASGGQFIPGSSLSAAERQQRCNNMCFNDCSVTFGVDALGAQFCTDVCTPDCVSRATTNTDLCPPPECNDGCSQPSDCGDVSRFSCSAGCCFETIF